jgi:outer membrane protein TolC
MRRAFCGRWGPDHANDLRCRTSARDVGRRSCRLRRHSGNYRQTTLRAFQQVEDNLAALRILEQEAQQQRSAVESAQDSLQLFTNRYRSGVDNYLQVITAQTITLTNQRAEIDILRRRMDASVLLVQALGGGWDVAALPRP